MSAASRHGAGETLERGLADQFSRGGFRRFNALGHFKQMLEVLQELQVRALHGRNVDPARDDRRCG